MGLPSNIKEYGNKILIHDKGQIDAQIVYLRQKLEKKGLAQEDISKIIKEYQLAFSNHFIESSHYINYLFGGSTTKVPENITNEFCNYLFIFLKQFYKDDALIMTINSPKDVLNTFKYHYESIEKLMSQCHERASTEPLKDNYLSYNNSILFFSKIEEFLIRFYDYTVIGISGQPFIISSCKKCSDKMIDYLLKGYILKRIQKIQFIEDPPHFELIPLLPIRDVGFPIDEYMEVSDEEKPYTIKRLKRIQ